MDVVIGCNFCPFANREVKHDRVHYAVEFNASLQRCLEAFMKECKRLDDNEDIATTLLILPNGFENFDGYLHLVDLAETLLADNGYEGIYQVAGFHPLYRFAGSDLDDAANYTNRSVYPMLHLLREESIEAALQNYPDPGNIPMRNIDFARNKGTAYMQMLRNACL